MKHKVYRKEFSLDALNLVKNKDYAAEVLQVSRSGYYRWRSQSIYKGD